MSVVAELVLSSENESLSVHWSRRRNRTNGINSLAASHMSLMELFNLPKYTYSPIQAGWVFCAFELPRMSCERTEPMQAPLGFFYSAI